jgi:Helix-turn-helix domain
MVREALGCVITYLDGLLRLGKLRDHVGRSNDTVAAGGNMTERLKKGTRVTGADRSKLATDLRERYAAGESIRSLAAASGRSYGFVHRILTENGVKLRGRGGATRGKAKAGA